MPRFYIILVIIEPRHFLVCFWERNSFCSEAVERKPAKAILKQNLRSVILRHRITAGNVDSIGVQGDNTVDKGLISASFALLSLWTYAD